MTDIKKIFPLPWRVAYDQRFPSWDCKSMPRIVDANGEIILKMPQSIAIHHPGDFDAEAVALAHLIVNSVNMETSNGH